MRLMTCWRLLRRRLLALLLTAGLVGLSLAMAAGPRGSYGRLAGSVTDSNGNPLMGATVLILGPVWGTPSGASASSEHLITDAHGGFTVERLVPGWYSLRVVSATRLPVLRNGVRVEAGRTAEQKFVLSDILAPLRVAVPSARVTVSGDDWKWVLRSSASTRPVLRYTDRVQAANRRAPVSNSKETLPTGHRLVGLIPGSARGETLASDPGMGSVLAYLRPLSEDSDVLVAAGSMLAYGPQTSSLATAFRHHLSKGDPEELTLIVHQLSFSGGVQFTSFARAQGVVVGYSHTLRLSDSLTVTGGFELDYLDALRNALASSPRVKVEYRASPSTLVAIRYGAIQPDNDSGGMLERVGMLNAFPRVTLRNDRLRLERFNHGELSVRRHLTRSSSVELAGFQDYFQNAAVWTVGAAGTSPWLARNLMPNPSSGGLILNAGDYRSSGARAAYSIHLGSHLDAALDYAVGEALTLSAVRFASDDALRGFHTIFRPRPSRSFGGKVSTQIPLSHTQFTTSYQLLERGRLTGVDPYGQADLEVQPFLGVQIRQPLPTLGSLPARIEALADFRNLLGQGYVMLPRSDGKPLLLTSAYRSLRGGFSVQF